MTEEKLCLWLQEDILNRRTLVAQLLPKGALGKGKRGSRAAEAALEPPLFGTTEEEDLAAIAA